jgi:hypothetical protein
MNETVNLRNFTIVRMHGKLRITHVGIGIGVSFVDPH